MSNIAKFLTLIISSVFITGCQLTPEKPPEVVGAYRPINPPEKPKYNAVVVDTTQDDVVSKLNPPRKHRKVKNVR